MKHIVNQERLDDKKIISQNVCEMNIILANWTIQFSNAQIFPVRKLFYESRAKRERTICSGTANTERRSDNTEQTDVLFRTIREIKEHFDISDLQCRTHPYIVDVLSSANISVLKKTTTTIKEKQKTIHIYLGLSIVNGAPAMEDPDEEILKHCDIFCINETEVREYKKKTPLDTSRK